MKDILINKAAAHFGNGNAVIESISTGLIHGTFKVQFSSSNDAIVMQCINQRTFSLPENIIQNYLMIYGYLKSQGNSIKIPALVPTLQNKYFWVDEEDNFWRATRFLPNSCSLPVALNEKDARQAARCFAEFTHSLTGLDSSTLYIIIPNFHNLQLRYQQFEDAISQSGDHAAFAVNTYHLRIEAKKKPGAVFCGVNQRNRLSYKGNAPRLQNEQHTF